MRWWQAFVDFVEGLMPEPLLSVALRVMARAPS